MNTNNIKNLNVPVFLLNVPFSLATEQPNNIWMNELKPEDRQIDHSRAVHQWLKLYQFLASQGIVYVLPSQPGLQDQTYVSNLGIVLPHTENNVVVISNFRSEPRRGETAVGQQFFASMGFECVIAPPYFEGEADLKHLRDNIYFGAYDIRTSMNTLNWFRDVYDMNVIPIKMTDEYLYHLDCVIFPLTSEKVLVCTKLCDDETLRSIEQVAEIIDVDYKLARVGITNNVRFGDYVLCDFALDEFEDEYYDEKHYNEELFANFAVRTRSWIETTRAHPQRGHEFASNEKRKLDKLTVLCAENGLELVTFNLSEFYKSGALLSCLVMKLNYPHT